MKEIAVEHTSMFKKGARLNFQVFHTLEIGSKNLEFMHLISSAVLSGHMDNYATCLSIKSSTNPDTKYHVYYSGDKCTFSKCSKSKQLADPYN